MKLVLKKRKYYLEAGESAPEAYISLIDNPDEVFQSRSTKLKRSVKNSMNRLKKETEFKFMELTEAEYSWQKSKKNHA